MIIPFFKTINKSEFILAITQIEYISTCIFEFKLLDLYLHLRVFKLLFELKYGKYYYLNPYLTIIVQSALAPTFERLS